MKTTRGRAARAVTQPRTQPKTYAWPIIIKDDTPRRPPHGRRPDDDNGDGRHDGSRPGGPGERRPDGRRPDGRMPGDDRRADRVIEILNVLLTAEKLESAMYARGLQSPALQGLPPDEFAYFQAGLSHELAHVDVLTELGASVPYEEFFFPPGTFEDLTIYANTLLELETAGVSAYIQASYEFARMGRLDLSRLMDQIMGVEAEHRTLLRDVLELIPADNLCFERAPNEPVSQILAALPAFLRPNQFNGGSVGPVALPSPELAAELIGPFGCPNPTPDL